MAATMLRKFSALTVLTLVFAAVYSYTIPEEKRRVKRWEEFPNVTLTFDCTGRSVGFYADQEFDCTIFHMCDEDGRRIPYMCGNGTAFNQRLRNCDWPKNVKCPEAQNWYYLNDLTYETDPPGEQQQRPQQPQQQTTRPPQIQSGQQQLAQADEEPIQPPGPPAQSPPAQRPPAPPAQPQRPPAPPAQTQRPPAPPAPQQPPQMPPKQMQQPAMPPKQMQPPAMPPKQMQQPAMPAKQMQQPPMQQMMPVQHS